MTGTAAEIIPVVKIDGRTIGTGKPGKITLDLLKGIETLQEMVVKRFPWVLVLRRM